MKSSSTIVARGVRRHGWRRVRYWEVDANDRLLLLGSADPVAADNLRITDLQRELEAIREVISANEQFNGVRIATLAISPNVATGMWRAGELRREHFEHAELDFGVIYTTLEIDGINVEIRQCRRYHFEITHHPYGDGVNLSARLIRSAEDLFPKRGVAPY